jgi:hypothetical protein
MEGYVNNYIETQSFTAQDISQVQSTENSIGYVGRKLDWVQFVITECLCMSTSGLLAKYL